MKLRVLFIALVALGALSALVLHAVAQPGKAPAKQTPAGKAPPTIRTGAPKVPPTAVVAQGEVRRLADPERITQGSLRILDEKGQPTGECPLKHTDVQTSISGFVARVTVTQQFHNPTKEKIEAVYVFPLSQNGAVDRMEMKVGDRLIRGQIKRREEARRIYEEAKAAGHVASLLDQERPNIFTQSVANIVPGAEVEVRISYVETLSYDEGAFKFSFPMVVGPRFIPGEPTGKQGTGWSPDTTQVPDASRITPPVARPSGGDVNPPRPVGQGGGTTAEAGPAPEGSGGGAAAPAGPAAPPEKRAGHDLSLSVDLDAGFAVTDIRSEQHEVSVRRIDSGRSQITLTDQATIPNKDFILTYRPASDQISDAVLMHAGPKGRFLTLILQPPPRPTEAQIAPKEMVFVVDSSGSMSGYPIEKAKETMKLCIEGMHPDDTFNLHTFNNGVVSCFNGPVPNSDANRATALAFLGSRVGGGGTQMLPAIDAALNPPADPKRVRIVCFMTDGYVGNDMQIIDRVQKSRGSARFFSFGVGSSVNRFLLDQMAAQGRGEVEYVHLTEPGRPAAERFHRRIDSPILTDISVDWGGLGVEDVYPQFIPDLFAAKPLVLKARYTRAGTSLITLKGKTGGRPFERMIRVDLPKEEAGHDVLAPLWARARIDHLMSGDMAGIQRGVPKPEVKDEITGLGLDFGLMTQYTSFVAVEEMVVTEGGKARTIAVPVEMPEGVSHEGVFGKQERGGQIVAGATANYFVTRRLSAAPAAAGAAGGLGGGYGGYGGGGARYGSPVASRAGAVSSRGPATPPPAALAPAGSAGAPPTVGGRPATAPAKIPAVPAPPMVGGFAPGRTSAADSSAEGGRANAARPLTPEEQRQAKLKARLDPVLLELPARYAREGKAGALKSDKLEVKAGKVEVAVWLSDASEKTLARLKALGLEVVIQAAGAKMVVGRIPVAKLEALALLDEVRRVELPAYR